MSLGRSSCCSLVHSATLSGKARVRAMAAVRSQRLGTSGFRGLPLYLITASALPHHCLSLPHHCLSLPHHCLSLPHASGSTGSSPVSLPLRPLCPMAQERRHDVCMAPFFSHKSFIFVNDL